VHKAGDLFCWGYNKHNIWEKEVKMRTTFDRINAFLDKYVLPWPVRFLTFRFTIIATIGLLIPLVLFANNTVMASTITVLSQRDERGRQFDRATVCYDR
jgi:hypothetical protein